MTLQNQPALPETAREEKTTFTYADLTTYLLRVMFLLEKYDVTLDRAQNESSVHRYGNRINYAYRKSSVHLSVLMENSVNAAPMLYVSLSFPSEHEGEREKGKIAIRCYPRHASWETSVLLFGDSDSTKELRRITKEACHIDIPSDQYERMYTGVLTEQQAFAAITCFIEVFKSSSREES